MELLAFYNNIFHPEIIDLLGGINKFKSYPIIKSLDNIPPKIGIGNEDGKPIFSLTIRWRGNIYTEIFRQKNINDFSIWKCTNKTYIFSQSEYNLLFLEEIELSDITNIKHLISNKNLVSIFNFTNEGSISANILSEYAELI